MIDKTPSNLDAFLEPIAGQPIPRGWFGRLVRFMNSLILRGDKRYFAVSHTMGGTLIAPSKALIDALERSGSSPAAGGGASGFPVYASGSSVTFGTAYPAASNSWLIGSVGASMYEICDATWSIELKNTASGTSITSFQLARLVSNIPTTANNFSSYFPVCLPIPAGVTFTVSLSTSLASGYIDNRLYLYPAS